MNPHDHSHCCSRRGGLISFLLKLILLYVALVVGAGTLVNTGQPVAMELGWLIRTVTFIDPAISWSQSRGYEHVAAGLTTLANGIPL